METSKPKPLTYDALRSVLKYTSFEKRQEIHCRIPQLRKTNAIIPYQFQKVEISPVSISLNDRNWHFGDVVNKQSGIVETIENKCKVYYHPGENSMILDKSPDEAIEEMFKTFINDGTTIKRFVLESFCQYMMKRNPETFKLKVSEIDINFWNLEEYNQLWPYIDEKLLKDIGLLFDDGHEPLLDLPLIKNCPKLAINYCGYDDPFQWDEFNFFKNNLLKLSLEIFPIDEVQALVVKWKESHRPIGSTLIIEANTFWKRDMNRLIERLTNQLGAIPSEMAANTNSQIETCVTMTMTNDNDSELVVYKVKDRSIFSSMTVKIMQTGATTILDESFESKLKLTE